MARGRGKSTVACAAAAAVAATLVAGCGAEEHANDPRPAPPTPLTISISEKKVSVAPVTVGVLRPAIRAEAIEQGVEQNTPLLATLTIANLTNFDSHIELRGAKQSTSPLVVANGTASYSAFLPTGEYLVSAADIPGAISARLSVGPDRVSSDSDLELP